MVREGLVVDLTLRYVDDVRIFLPSLNEGWEWNGRNFSFSWERRKRELEKGEHDSWRTTQQIAKAMTSMVDCLNFTGEDQSMFPSRKLPTLDTEIWMQGENVRFRF